MSVPNPIYWATRLQERQDTLHALTLDEMQREYIRAYTSAYSAVERDITALYDILLKEVADGKIKPNDLYRYNRYFEVQSQINSRLRSLGQAELNITNAKLLTMYELTQKLVTREVAERFNTTFILDTPNGAKAAIDSIWCYDGEHWSDRIWKHKSALQSRIEKGLLDSIIRGVPKDELVKELNKAFNVGFYCSDRIARTELTYVQNKAAIDRYKSNGVDKYKYLAAIDDRTSAICTEMNGKEFLLSECTIGTNAPPLHPNCRCTIIPIIDKGGS